MGNLTVEFHYGKYGEDVMSENSFSGISNHLDVNSTILLGNCFAGKAAYISRISCVANGATVIGHEGYQNNIGFLANGSLTGANTNVLGAGRLNDDMFKHTVVQDGISKTGVLLSTHVSNSGRISTKHLSQRRVDRILNAWKNIKSKFMMIVEAIFNTKRL